jgi:DNA-directed RNA polymerase specialized sigma24 family protein
MPAVGDLLRCIDDPLRQSVEEWLRECALGTARKDATHARLLDGLRPIARKLAKRLGDDADDLLSASLIRVLDLDYDVLRHAPRGVSLGAWVAGITRTVARERRRERLRRGTLLERNARLLLRENPLGDAGDACERADSARHVMRIAERHLPPFCRAIFALRLEAGLPSSFVRHVVAGQRARYATAARVDSALSESKAMVRQAVGGGTLPRSKPRRFRWHVHQHVGGSDDRDSRRYVTNPIGPSAQNLEFYEGRPFSGQ